MFIFSIPLESIIYHSANISHYPSNSHLAHQVDHFTRFHTLHSALNRTPPPSHLHLRNPLRAIAHSDGGESRAINGENDWCPRTLKQFTFSDVF